MMGACLTASPTAPRHHPGEEGSMAVAIGSWRDDRPRVGTNGSRAARLASLFLAALAIWICPARPILAEVVSRSSERGYNLSVTFQPPAGWQRQQQGADIGYVVGNPQGAFCTIIFNPVEFYSGPMTYVSYFNSKWSDFLASPLGRGVIR
jgi:hypothetical protein